MTIRKIKVSELPSASSLTGLKVLGVDGANNSVGVAIELLRGNGIELQKTSTAVQWRAIGGSWADLVQLTDITQALAMQNTGTELQWKTGNGAWVTLISLAALHQIATDAAAAALASQNAAAGSAGSASTASSASVTAKGLSESARDVAVAAKDITVTKAAEVATNTTAAAASAQAAQDAMGSDEIQLALINSFRF